MRGHYEGLAAKYDEHWVYGRDFVPWMSGQIAEVLRLASTDRIADSGSGMGLFAREVAGVSRGFMTVPCEVGPTPTSHARRRR